MKWYRVLSSNAIRRVGQTYGHQRFVSMVLREVLRNVGWGRRVLAESACGCWVMELRNSSDSVNYRPQQRSVGTMSEGIALQVAMPSWSLSSQHFNSGLLDRNCAISSSLPFVIIPACDDGLAQFTLLLRAFGMVDFCWRGALSGSDGTCVSFKTQGMIFTSRHLTSCHVRQCNVTCCSFMLNDVYNVISCHVM
jgi:hypothetical protein